MESIDHLKVKEYLDKLAEPSFPGPASGSATATTIATGSALLEMAYKVTVKKGEGRVSINLKEIEAVRRQTLNLATEDVEVLAGIIQAAKYRKESPDKYQLAMIEGTDTLVAIAQNGAFILEQMEQLIPICNKRVFAELIAGAYMTEAAVQSVILGVETNLYLLQDGEYKEKVQAEMNTISENCSDIKVRIMDDLNG